MKQIKKDAREGTEFFPNCLNYLSTQCQKTLDFKLWILLGKNINVLHHPVKKI